MDDSGASVVIPRLFDAGGGDVGISVLDAAGHKLGERYLGIVEHHCVSRCREYWSDYFDYKHKVDARDTFGAKTLTDGMFTPREIYRLSMALLAVALVAGIGLLWRTGLPLLYIGIGGAACSLLYPPLKYRALGDVVIFGVCLAADVGHLLCGYGSS